MRPPLGLIRLERARREALNESDEDFLDVFVNVLLFQNFPHMMLEDIVEVTLALRTATSDPRECVIQHLLDFLFVQRIATDEL